MNAPHLFLFMSLALATVSVAHADTTPAPGTNEVPSTVASPDASVTKDLTNDSVTTKVTRKKKVKKQPKKKKAPLAETPVITEVTVPMAKGELEAEVAAEQAQRERANAPRTSAELGVSSWKPKRATSYSRVAGTSDFTTKGIPSIDATVFAPLFGHHDLHVEGGLGFLALHRTASITGTGLNVPVDENGYILSFRVGVTYFPYKFLHDELTPYISGALLPSLLVTRESSLDDGTSDSGLPLELGVGILVRLGDTLSLDLGLTETFGHVQESDFNKFAARAGLRLAM